MILVIEPDENWQRIASQIFEDLGEPYCFARNLKQACHQLGISYKELVETRIITRIREINPIEGVITELRFPDNGKNDCWGLVVMEICNQLRILCVGITNQNLKDINAAHCLAGLRNGQIIGEMLRNAKSVWESACRAVMPARKEEKLKILD